MSPFLVRPLDPLVFGTGRPFSAIPGARLESLPLAPPSTLAGMVRTVSGLGADGRFRTSMIDELLARRIVGPFVVVLGDPPQLALPQPADAQRLVFGAKNQVRRLVPLEIGDGDLYSEPDLVPVGHPTPNRVKPPRSVPDYWRAPDVTRWLVEPPEPDDPWIVGPEWGVTGPTAERRIHVRVDPSSGTASEGGLFSTDGRRFHGKVDGEWAHLALYGETDAELDLPTHAVLGGEGRLSRLEAYDRPSLIPTIPDAVVESARTGFVRAYLLTPAPLGGSRWTPSGATVVGQANGRPLVTSGWQMAPLEPADSRYPVARNESGRRGGPKPVRRLMPAGTVFFLKLSGDADADEAFVRSRWGRSVASGQDARDGFGIALFGTWNDGRRYPLNVEVTP